MLVTVLALLRALVCALSHLPWLRDAIATLAFHLRLPRLQRGYWRLAPPATCIFIRSPTKPPWVRQDIIRLKALMSDAGTCRAIEKIFNRRFAKKKNMTVGKTFVNEVIRKHRYEIDILRKRIKRARPKRVPRNLIWAADLTGKTTLDGSTHLILAILEHASRAALWLEVLQTKSSWALIGKLVQAIKRHGKPRVLRTDNESVFTSQAFRFALGLLGIRHQRTDPGCPWQNGRVERFFGTLKEKPDQLAVGSCQALNVALIEFRFFYHYVRPHQKPERADACRSMGRCRSVRGEGQSRVLV